MSCKCLCSEYPARRITRKYGSLYHDNFYCKTCHVYINPLGVFQSNRGIICTCCQNKVKTKSYRKKPLVISLKSQ